MVSCSVSTFDSANSSFASSSAAAAAALVLVVTFNFPFPWWKLAGSFLVSAFYNDCPAVEWRWWWSWGPVIIITIREIIGQSHRTMRGRRSWFRKFWGKVFSSCALQDQPPPELKVGGQISVDEKCKVQKWFIRPFYGIHILVKEITSPLNMMMMMVVVSSRQFPRNWKWTLMGIEFFIIFNERGNKYYFISAIKQRYVDNNGGRPARENEQEDN